MRTPAFLLLSTLAACPPCGDEDSLDPSELAAPQDDAAWKELLEEAGQEEEPNLIESSCVDVSRDVECVTTPLPEQE